MRFAASEVAKNFRWARGTGASTSLSMALIASGIWSVSVGVAMTVGMLIAWAGLVPMLTTITGSRDIDKLVNTHFPQRGCAHRAGTIASRRSGACSHHRPIIKASVRP